MKSMAANTFQTFFTSLKVLQKYLEPPVTKKAAHQLNANSIGKLRVFSRLGTAVRADLKSHLPPFLLWKGITKEVKVFIISIYDKLFSYSSLEI